jgi:LPS export ABC transporter protein LptC
MQDLSYVHVVNTRPQLSFQAASADRYEKSQTMDLKTVTFKQLGEDAGKNIQVESTGSADQVHVDTHTNNITLEGNVKIYSKSEDVTIASPSLSWENNSRNISSGADDTVSLSRGDGSTASGKGFSANTRNRTWEFSGPVSGVYNNDNKKQNQGSK